MQGRRHHEQCKQMHFGYFLYCFGAKAGGVNDSIAACGFQDHGPSHFSDFRADVPSYHAMIAYVSSSENSSTGSNATTPAAAKRQKVAVRLHVVGHAVHQQSSEASAKAQTSRAADGCY